MMTLYSVATVAVQAVPTGVRVLTKKWNYTIATCYHLTKRMSSSSSQEAVISKDDVHDFVVRCMTKVGSKPSHTQDLANLLMTADYRGHYSHGINRLDMYVRDIQSGITSKEEEPVIVKETAATALVDGKNVLGPAVGKMCIDLAIQKAKESGIGWVSARGSNHFGIAGWYAIRAKEQGMIGMAFTNTSPLMMPTRSKQNILGTNPIACAAPANNGDEFVLDMATTAVALGKLELNERKGLDIPEGWGCDSTGRTTTNPSEAKGLMPLGGTEECSGYKGYGLSMMVEMFCGILSGAEYGNHIRRWKTTDRVANLGQCFVAIDPEAFAPGFSDRLTELNTTLRNSDPAEGETEVLVPGDPEKKHQDLCDSLGGIPYHANQVTFMNNLASELGISPPKLVEMDK